MKGQRIGYVRVSSVDQNTVRQLEGEQLDQIFEDKASGKDTNRPQLQAMLKFVREGDTVVVHSMDRLGRNFDDLRGLVTSLTKRGIRVKFVKESLEFTGEDTPLAKMLLNMLGSVAEFERDMIRERQREGIAIAKAKGNVYLGRKRSLSEEQAVELRKRVAAKEPKAALAREYGISRETLYAYLRA